MCIVNSTYIYSKFNSLKYKLKICIVYLYFVFFLIVNQKIKKDTKDTLTVIILWKFKESIHFEIFYKIVKYEDLIMYKYL